MSQIIMAGAGILKLLDQTPGWAMGLGQKPLFKLVISLVIDALGLFLVPNSN